MKLSLNTSPGTPSSLIGTRPDGRARRVAPGASPGADGGKGRGGRRSAPRRQYGPAEAAALSAEQRAAVAAIDAFIADPARSLFVVHGRSGSGKSRIRTTFEPRTRFENVVTGMAGAMAARAAESDRSKGWPGLRDWLNGRVVVLDDAGVARHADVAALRRRGARIVGLVDPDRLPPVHGSDPAFQRADFTLTELHPAAIADPIRAQARAVLAGEDYRDEVTPSGSKTAGGREDLINADIVLCGQDKTRQRLNQLARVARGYIAGPVTADDAFDPIVAGPKEGRAHPRPAVRRVSPRRDRVAGGISQTEGHTRPSSGPRWLRLSGRTERRAVPGMPSISRTRGQQ